MIRNEYEVLELRKKLAGGYLVVPWAVWEIRSSADRNLLLWLLGRAKYRGPLRGVARYVRKEAAEGTGLSIQQVRSAERRLVEEGWIKATPGQHPDNTGYMIATICDFKELQDLQLYQQHPVNTRSTPLNKEETENRKHVPAAPGVEKMERCPFCSDGREHNTGEPCPKCEAGRTLVPREPKPRATDVESRKDRDPAGQPARGQDEGIE